MTGIQNVVVEDSLRVGVPIQGTCPHRLEIPILILGAFLRACDSISLRIPAYMQRVRSLDELAALIRVIEFRRKVVLEDYPDFHLQIIGCRYA